MSNVHVHTEYSVKWYTSTICSLCGFDRHETLSIPHGRLAMSTVCQQGF